MFVLGGTRVERTSSRFGVSDVGEGFANCFLSLAFVGPGCPSGQETLGVRCVPVVDLLAVDATAGAVVSESSFSQYGILRGRRREVA